MNQMQLLPRTIFKLSRPTENDLFDLADLYLR